MAVKKTEVKTTSKAETKKNVEKINVDKEVVATPKVVKEEVKKVVSPKTNEKKAAPKKAATPKGAKEKETIYLQFGGKEIPTKDLIAQAHKIWTKELGNKASAIKSLKLYLKPEECAAYYVFNDVVTGKIEL